MNRLVQLSVFVENRPGRMAHIARILADASLNIVALSLAETESYGIVRMLVDDPEKGEKLLHEQGMTSIKTTVVGIKLDNHAGSILRVLEVLGREDLNIEYLYAAAEKETAIICRFQDYERALEVLGKEGFEFLTNEDLVH